MNIRKIVLADDEGTQLKILSSLIQKISPQTQVILCSSGNEAWEAIKEGGVELLITDIRMPAMDGMELIRQVSEQHPQISIVLVSAYQEFDYAREAIACGVSEYLVKPFRLKDIQMLLSKMEARICSLREENERNLDYEALLLKNHRNDRQKKLLSMMYKHTSWKDAPDDFLTEFLSRPGLIAVLRWKIRTDFASASSAPFCLSHHQQELLTEHLLCLFPTDALVPLDNFLNSNERRLALLLSGFTEARCRECLKELMVLSRSSHIVFQAGLSESQDNLLFTLHEALRQAEEALSFSFYFVGQTMLFSVSDNFIHPDLPIPSLSGFERDIRKAVHTGNLPEMRQSLTALRKEFSRKPFLAPSRIRHGVSSLVVSIIKDLDGMISRKEYDNILNNAYCLYSSCDSLEELFDVSLSLLEQTAAYFIQESGQYDTVEDVIFWLKKHFTEELSLQQLAERVHFSASYLSSQILKKTGMSYSRYLSYLRTEKARQLLLETDLKVMDIAVSCGYRDSSYFNRIFHRKYGVSPEQYRKAHKKC